MEGEEGVEDGAEKLYESAVCFRDDGKLPDAMSVVLELLSQYPDNPRGRLLLAHLYYLSGCTELASEEVKRLKEQHPDRESLARLLVALDPSFLVADDSESCADEAAPVEDGEGDVQPDETALETKKHDDKAPEGAVLAETDFEFDELDLLED